MEITFSKVKSVKIGQVGRRDRPWTRITVVEHDGQEHDIELFPIIRGTPIKIEEINDDG